MELGAAGQNPEQCKHRESKDSELVWETQLPKSCSVNFDLDWRVGLAHRPEDKGSPLELKGSSIEATSPLQARELWAEGFLVVESHSGGYHRSESTMHLHDKVDGHIPFLVDGSCCY